MSLGRGLGSVELRVLSCAQRRPAASGAFETRELSAQVVTADAAGEDGRAARTRALPSVCLSKYKWEEEEGRQVRGARVRASVRSHTHAHAHAYTRPYAWVYTRTRARTRAATHSLTYTHTCAHTHTHAYAFLALPRAVPPARRRCA